MSQIAYTTFSGDLCTVFRDGSDLQKLTSVSSQDDRSYNLFENIQLPHSRYTWPTWSPNNKVLAVSRIDTDNSYSLHSIEISTGNITTIFSNELNTAPVGRGVPHVMSWSPDGNHLAFLASTPTSLALYVATPGTLDQPTLLTRGGPIYFNWSEDSNSLLIHCGRELSIARINNHENPTVHSIGNVGSSFKVPSLYMNDSNFIWNFDGPHGNGVYVGSVQSHLSQAKLVLKTSPPVAFRLSSMNDELLIADTINEVRPVFQRLTKVNLNGTVQSCLINEPYLAFFWSPDNKRIVYLTFNIERSSLIWKHLSLPDNNPVELFEFWPSDLMLTMVSDFDQFSLSNAIWSSDSQSIVFCGTLTPRSGRRNGHSPGQDKIYVLDMSTGEKPRELAYGTFAVWSWT